MNPPEDSKKIDILDEVLEELEKATTKFGPFASPHEGYAILLEEMNELWSAVKANDYSANTRNEAIQIAAMAIRFVYDIFDSNRKIGKP